MILGALCLRLAARQDDRPVARIDLLVHFLFAVWFLMRPDVLPAWAIVSLILHAHDPRRLLLPIAFAAAIGVGWAGYKMRYTGEFVPTTSTTGASLLCGLWEVPSRFPWVCSDESYSRGCRRIRRSSEVAGRQQRRRARVVRFWFTYPGHFVFMVFNKMMRCLGGDLWPGMPTALQQSVFEIFGRGRSSAVPDDYRAVAASYQRSRTLLAAAVPQRAGVLDHADERRAVLRRRWRGTAGRGGATAARSGLLSALIERHRATVVVLVSVAVLSTVAWPLRWLLRNDAFHYWTPFLDPSASSFAVVR
jgi:hypothetical protein